MVKIQSWEKMVGTGKAGRLSFTVPFGQEKFAAKTIYFVRVQRK